MSKGSIGWQRKSDGGYYSNHITVMYRGKKVPKYFIRRNPYGKGWVIFVFNPTTGGYTMINGMHTFLTLKDAATHVDNVMSVGI